MKRRKFLIASAIASTTSAESSTKAEKTHKLISQDSAVLSRIIPSTGEQLPCIGVGTSRTFDVGDDAGAKNALRYVLKALVDGGGSVVDSSPMYGSSESVVGELASEMHLRDKLFMASKVWTTGETAGANQMETSSTRMHAPKMDLMQVHNLLDTDTHMKTMLDLKEKGKIRYTGLSHYRANAHPELETMMRKYSPDFIQINYSILENEAEQRILPLAQDMGIAVLINRPFMRGKLFNSTRQQTLPKWSEEFDCQTWGQLFLKYVIANEAVTCVIPGTSKLKHMQDNLAAGRGALPSARHLDAINKLFKS